MKPATHESLDKEQSAFLLQLNQAIEQINQADDLVARNRGSGSVTEEATAWLLSAIARVLVVQTAQQHNMVNRLATFTHNTAK